MDGNGVRGVICLLHFDPFFRLKMGLDACLLLPPKERPTIASSKQSPVIYALIGAIVVLVGVVLLLAYFSLRAPDETTAITSTRTSESTSASASPTEDRCGVLAQNAVSGMTEPQQQYCDGEWLWAGQEQSDHLNLYHWTDRWEYFKPDGTDNYAGYDCYDEDRLEAAGAPGELVDKLNICTSDAPATSQAKAAEDEFAWAGPPLQCDGRYILIVESVLVAPGDNPYDPTWEALKKWPGAHVSYAVCSSLRGTYDGKDVYAVYYDAGHSVSEVCALKAKYGGNARSLNNAGDFSDPC
ncbi:hypothetical protein I6J21_00440 [Corynebacterium glucuronolyticum]|uniref:Uncharacterized protein n=3 Tax=Corynebacterium glucuronolyticum TaxID=39791 RepID=A0AAX1L8E8_9CORY|nr:hypothetical protein HMPREF0293_0632 [Corynebacterium glucuronolyticum ATCC 51866]QRP70686.1 hypothetical protein I6J21_00440 [Corynebacterium glucuronolyticum]